jgi:hypothetical protein
MGACVAEAESAKEKTLPTPDTMVMLDVTSPDGTVSELVVADGDLATVKMDEEHIFGFTPKISGANAVTVNVAALEMGDKPHWNKLETVKVAGEEAVATKTKPSFSLKLEAIKKVASTK